MAARRIVERAGWRFGWILLTFACVPGWASARERSVKPNIIVILADDLGYGDVGCFQRLHAGMRDAKTPSIDALAENGVMLTDFYGHPVCTPARYCLLTGRHLMRSRDLRDLVVLDYDFPQKGLRKGETTLADVLQAEGYQTAIIGKWHLGSGEMVIPMPPMPPFPEKNEFHPNSHGFDYFYGFLGGSIDYCTHEKRAAYFDWYENRTVLYRSDERGVNVHPDHERYATHLVTEKSVELIDRFSQSDKPFFLYVAYPAPHWAQTVRQDPLHVHQLPREESDPNSERYRYYLKRFDDVYSGGDKTNWRKRLLAMVSAMDDGVGAIMERVKRLGLESETIIVFTSDNGGETHYGDNIVYGSSNGPFTRGDKASLYEGGIRVPAIIQAKGRLPAGRVSRQIASVVDLKSTLSRLAGIKTQRHCDDGVDLTPNLLDPKIIVERDFFYCSGHFGAVYRSGCWKYMRKSGKNSVDELYDLDTDLVEETNLAAERPEVVDLLKRKHATVLHHILEPGYRAKVSD